MNLLVLGALLFSFTFGNLYKFSIFSPDIRISILDITVSVITIFSLPLKVSKFKSLVFPIMLFSLISSLSLVIFGSRYGFQALLVGSLYWVRWIIYSLFFVSIAQSIKLENIKYILYSLIIGMTLLGLLQYIFFPDVRHLQIAGWDPHYYRIVGTFLDPGFTGILLVLALVFLTLKPLSAKALNLTLWTFTYLALALTYSRSSYLAFLVSMAYISWKRRSLKFLSVILVLFTLTIFLLPRTSDGEGVKLERTSSIQARIESWKTAWTIFIHNPILGVGFNTYRYAQGASLESHAGAGADSSLLFIAATTGIMGLITYLWYLKRVFSLNNLTVHCSLAALLIHSIFLNSLFYPFVMVWLSLLILSSSDSQPYQKQ